MQTSPSPSPSPVLGSSVPPGATAGKKSTFTAECWLPRPPAEVFPFFADAFNLQAITPPWLQFSVQTPAPIAMGVGTQIDYRLRLHGLPLRWQSLISVWDPPYCFVDEQINGPYRRWVHTHVFEAEAGGTRCRDFVDYAVPGGSLIDWLLVRRDLRRIFAYRQAALQRHFATPGRAPTAAGTPADAIPPHA